MLSKEALDELVKWLRHRSEVITNSLCCGDDGRTMANAHKDARRYALAADELQNMYIRIIAMQPVVEEPREQPQSVLSYKPLESDPLG